MQQRASHQPTIVPPQFRAANVHVETRADGAMIVRTDVPLVSVETLLHGHLRHWAEVTPQHPFLAERHPGGEGWRTIDYAEALQKASAIAAALAARPLGVDRPILILSGNSIDHQLLALGAMMAGIPYTPLSVP